MWANLIDQLLARLDGKIAPLWLTQVMLLQKAPLVPSLKQALLDLVSETPRLNLSWSSKMGWRPCSRSSKQIFSQLQTYSKVKVLKTQVECLLRSPIDLSQDLPFRICLFPIQKGLESQWALVFQLHHSIGDARAFLDLTRRFFEHLAGHASQRKPLQSPLMTSGRILKKLIQYPFSLRHLLKPQFRLLAQRGYALPSLQKRVGSPLFTVLRFPFNEVLETNPKIRADFFYSLILSGIASSERGSSYQQGPIRLRIPIDLRPELGIENTLENPCSAIPVEIPLQVFQKGLQEPWALGGFVRAQIRTLLRKKLHWANLIESSLIGQFLSDEKLEFYTKRDLLASPRSNTLVVTYLGAVDPYYQFAPFPIQDIFSHTPTWGAHGFTFNGSLYLNLSGFEGISTRKSLERFARSILTWARQHHQIDGEILV